MELFYENTEKKKTLSVFTDADEIAPLASKAMTLFVNTGYVNGSGVLLNPLSTATRAEMAQIPYNLLSQ